MYTPLKLFWQITITDTKTGKIIRRTRKRLSHSFVKQFLQLLEFSFRHAWGGAGDTVNIIDTGNTSRAAAMDTMNSATTAVPRYFFAVDAPEDDDTYGIVVGSDNTAEDNTDYKLNTQIADGAAAGELDYTSHTWVTSAVVGANVDFQIQRPFINNSGGNVTIEECGIYLKTWCVSGSTMVTGYIFCIVRDTTGTVTVADGQTATVDYTFRTTV